MVFFPFPMSFEPLFYPNTTFCGREVLEEKIFPNFHLRARDRQNRLPRLPFLANTTGCPKKVPDRIPSVGELLAKAKCEDCCPPQYVESPTSQFLQIRGSFCAVRVYALIDSKYRGGPQSSHLANGHREVIK